jgi:hypothetical protein
MRQDVYFDRKTITRAAADAWRVSWITCQTI